MNKKDKPEVYNFKLPEKRVTKKELRIRKHMLEIMAYIRKQIEFPYYPIGTDGVVYTPYSLHFTEVFGNKYPVATARIVEEYVKHGEQESLNK